MILINRIGLSISSPLGKSVTVPLQIAEDRLLELTVKIRSGQISKDEHDEIARGFIRLGVNIAGKFAATHPHYTDDFVSCAMFAIVKALSEAKEKLIDDNITPYIAAKMHSLCQRFREKEKMYGMSYRQRQRLKKANKPVEENSKFSLEAISNPEENNIIRQYYRKVIRNSQSKIREIKEILTKSAKDQVDLHILKMRIEGYNDTEIAEDLNCSRSYINNRRNALEIRFEKLNRD